MDHEVVSRACRICDCLLISSQGHFDLHQGTKKPEWPWSLRSPKDIFQGLHYPLSWSKKFCGGRGKRCTLVKLKKKGPWPKNYCYNKSLMNLFWGEEKTKTVEDKRMVILNFFFPKLPFLDIYYKILTFTYCRMVIPLCPHSDYTLWGGPKGCVNWFFKKLDHEKKATFHGPNSWCKPALTLQLLLVNKFSRSNPWQRYFTTRLRKTML